METTCSLGYHQTKPANLETFALKIKGGVYGNLSTFIDPPFAKDVFDGAITIYVGAYGAYKAGGLAQKGAFLEAKKTLMDMLDQLSTFVDGVALGKETIIILSGFTPTKSSETAAVIPVQPVASLSRGTTGVIKAECEKVEGATYYGAIISAHALNNTQIDDGGNLVIGVGDTILKMDLKKTRKKQFINLTPKTDYFIYFYAVNSAGVSPLSDVQSIMCA